MSAPTPASVCLVEAHSAVRSHLSDLFRSNGFDVVAAVGTAPEAGQAIRSLIPQVAVIDAHLTDVRGIDLCGRLRLAAPDVPLILYAARISLEDERAAIALGVAAVVLKNVRIDELLTVMREHASGQTR